MNSMGHRREGKRDSWSGKLKLMSNGVATWNKGKNKKEPLDLPQKVHWERGGSCFCGIGVTETVLEGIVQKMGDKEWKQ